MKSVVSNLVRRTIGTISREVEENRFLLGRSLCLNTRRIPRVVSLSDVEFCVFSQWGEDGILDWLIEKLDIPFHTFIEFGVENYREANTRFLVRNRNWQGLIIDGSDKNIKFVERDEIYWKHDLIAKAAFINRENINEIIKSSDLSGEIGLLSVDIDGNDYWVWENINQIQPIICVCEYNAVFGDVQPISIPYDPTFTRNKAHHSNLYYGASITALCSLALRKGYRFVGTTSTGVNAFFVRSDYAARLDRLIDSTSPHPSRFRESRDERGNLTHLARARRADAIARLPVVNVETGAVHSLGELQPLYSATWTATMDGDAAAR